MKGWRDHWMATVFSDVLTREGLGWEFASFKEHIVWEVFRDDAGPFPVFSAVRHSDELPPAQELEEMTREAVADLLAAADLADEVGWMRDNISAALLLASVEITGWEGAEWALESGSDDRPLAWASPTDPRVPYAWLGALAEPASVAIGTYQDDALFGLHVHDSSRQAFLSNEEGSLRPTSAAPLITGRLTRVDVAYDTSVDGGATPGVLSEVLLTGDSGSTLLIAAEAQSAHVWSLYDESVVVLKDLDAAESVDWLPVRPRWRPPA